MAFIHYNFKSLVLECSTTITITLPDFVKIYKGKSLEDVYSGSMKLPTIYLLHGGGGTSSDWLRYTQIERLSNEKRFMTVSIDAMESFYTDMLHGRKYFTFATEEVPMIVQKLFPSSPERENNYIAGFSMGGHGAMKLALRCPEKYNAVLALSGAKDLVKMAKLAEKMGITASNSNITEAFGSVDNIYKSENDLLYLADRLKKSGEQQPRIFLGCGTEDYGYELCMEYKNYLDEIGMENKFISVPGIHDYFYANTMITMAVRELFGLEDWKKDE